MVGKEKASYLQVPFHACIHQRSPAIIRPRKIHICATPKQLTHYLQVSFLACLLLTRVAKPLKHSLAPISWS